VSEGGARKSEVVECRVLTGHVAAGWSPPLVRRARSQEREAGVVLPKKQPPRTPRTPRTIGSGGVHRRGCIGGLLKSPQKHPPRKAIRTYESLCLYVQENFQAAITRESVAQHFGLAPNHVSRSFRKEGFMRFNDYLNLVRVNRAKFMLQNYSLTLKEIAFDCGYNDTAYFCRVFKKTCKVTPTEYRAQSNRSPQNRRTGRQAEPALSPGTRHER